MLAMLIDPQPFNGVNSGMLAAMMGVYLVFMVIFLAIVMIPFWFILKKAGFTPWLTLINLVPLGTLILLYVIAFADWKVVPAPQLTWTPPTYPPQPPYPPQT